MRALLKKTIILFFVSIFILPFSSSKGQYFSSFSYPLQNSWNVTQDFNVWNGAFNGYHLGEDVVRDSESAVYATADGKVMHVAQHTGYGYVIIIQHQLPDNSYVCSVYGHLRAKDITVTGIVVNKGQLIGYLSSDPNENGGYDFTHLHFGIRSGLYNTNLDPDGKWRYRGYGPTDIVALWYDPTDFVTSKNGEGTTIVWDEFDGATEGNATGISYSNTPNGQGAVFNRTSESKIEYEFDSQIPREGTLELVIKVESGYSYSNYTLIENYPNPQIWGTDCNGGDVFWPGAMNIRVQNDGYICLTTETAYAQGVYTILEAFNTNFRFNEWHSIGISYGSQGQNINLDGDVVASNPNYTLPLSAAGNFRQPLDKPTIGELTSSFWGYNQYEGGFNGVVDRFRTSSKQNDWLLNTTAVKNEINYLTNYNLFQNYPNPFNPNTLINYSVPRQSKVTIIIYDALGRELTTLVNEEKLVGNYTVEFNASLLSSGIYFYQMKTDGFIQTKKMLLLR